MTGHFSQSRTRLDDQLLRELGEVVMTGLADPDVIEIMLNDDGTLWEDRHGKGMSRIGSMEATRALNLIGHVADALHIQVTRQSPVVEGELPIDGSRFEAIIPPNVERPIFAIRKRAIKIFTLADYLASGIMTAAQKDEIDRHIALKHNILVVGATGSGKTTLCNAILHRIAEIDPDTRMLLMEDTRELQCPIQNKSTIRTSEFLNFQQILRAVMRLRPDRITLGEIRDAAALDLLKSWNTGHPGGLCTVHANNAEAGLTRIEQLIQESGKTPIPAVIAEAINCIVSIQKGHGGRRVEQILTITGANAAGYVFTPH